DVAQDHERGRAVLPALADVRTVRFLADRMEVEVAHQLLQLQIPRAAGRFDLEPTRLALGERLRAVATSGLIKRLAHEPRDDVKRTCRLGNTARTNVASEAIGTA